MRTIRNPLIPFYPAGKIRENLHIKGDGTYKNYHVLPDIPVVLQILPSERGRHLSS